MESVELLCDSRICRLCGENNQMGYQLFAPGDEEAPSRLSNLINQYLPVKVKNDRKFPRWICPGCNIQVESTVDFFDLIIRGQERLRQLLKERQSDNLDEASKYDFTDFCEDSVLFPPSHELSMKMRGFEKPKRKRGRPPKLPPDELEAQRQKAEEEFLAKQRKEAQELREIEDSLEDGRRKRRVRIPARFQSVVQGKELEKAYVAEGVIDKTDISDTEDNAPIIENATDGEEGRGSQIIGHLKSSDGVVLSDLVVTQKTQFHRKGRVARLKTRFMCDVCSKSFSQELRFLTHRATHQNVRYECTECLENFIKKEMLKEHQVLTGHRGQGIVESVEVKGSSAITEAAKALYNLQNDSIRPQEMSQMTEIDEDFMNMPELQALEEVPDLSAFDPTLETQASFAANKKFVCSLCKMAFSYMQELRNHMSSHRTPPEYFCDICQKRFNDPSVVVFHKESEHSHTRRFACNKCDKEFMLKHQLQRHQNVHISLRLFECTVCKKRFKTKPHLQYHALCHSQDKKFCCDICGQRFHYNGALKHHYKWHSGYRPFKCPICEKSFLQRGILKEHIRIHTGERPYSCTHCDMSFKTGSQCRMHTQRHTSDFPWGCDICGKNFLKLESYKIHMRRHRNEKIFVCDVCQKGFAEQYALKKHLRTHTGEKPFKCATCGKTFSDRSNMIKHMRLHSETTAKVSIEATTETSAETNEQNTETVGDAKNTQETPADVPIVYQILNQNGLGGENNIIFVTTYPQKDQIIPPKDPSTVPSTDNIIRILDEKHPEEMLTMQGIPENPTNGIFSTSSIALQLDSTEDYRFLLTDK